MLSPLSRISQVPISDVLQFLIDLFTLWTLPKMIRSDNGEPFGVITMDVVPLMSLWLKSWGIAPVLNRPRRPTDNALVERAQGTTSRWAEVDKCPDLVTLQKRLDEVCAIQRGKYIVTRIGNVSRAKLYENLALDPRPFKMDHFDETHAYQFLAQAIMPRKVNANGVITIYSKPFSVGVNRKGEFLIVKFCPKQVAWLVFDLTGLLCKTIPDPRFNKENLINLTCQ